MSIIMDDLVHLFPNRKGTYDPALKFYTISAYANSPQPKGIFIPLYNTSGELLKAIENGAVAALWNTEIPIPPYTPNQFIIFYTDDLWKGLKNMVELYRKNYEYDLEKTERITFNFLAGNSMKVIDNTYDLAIAVKELDTLLEGKNIQKEGI